jgi:hypothetical protein
MDHLPMKTIIAGGRDYTERQGDAEFLSRIGVSEVISGGCRGGDEFGEIWARRIALPVTKIAADWKTYGKAAGPMRNEAMAKQAQAVVLFPGGKGTANMEATARKHGLKIFKRL